jgi:hypothetical protein
MQTKVCWSSFLIILLSCTSPPSSAQNRVHQLARDVYYWSADLSKHEQTNVGFVVFRDYVLVIDANFPWAAEKIIADIKTITPKPIRFVVVQGHVIGYELAYDMEVAPDHCERSEEECRKFQGPRGINQPQPAVYEEITI